MGPFRLGLAEVAADAQLAQGGCRRRRGRAPGACGCFRRIAGSQAPRDRRRSRHGRGHDGALHARHDQSWATGLAAVSSRHRRGCRGSTMPRGLSPCRWRASRPAWQEAAADRPRRRPPFEAGDVAMAGRSRPGNASTLTDARLVPRPKEQGAGDHCRRTRTRKSGHGSGDGFHLRTGPVPLSAPGVAWQTDRLAAARYLPSHRQLHVRNPRAAPCDTPVRRKSERRLTGESTDVQPRLVSDAGPRRRSCRR